MVEAGRPDNDDNMKNALHFDFSPATEALKSNTIDLKD